MNDYILGIPKIFVKFEFAYINGRIKSVVNRLYWCKKKVSKLHFITYYKLKVWVNAIQLGNFYFNINWLNKVRLINHSYAQYLHIKKSALPFFDDFNYYIANMCTLVR